METPPHIAVYSRDNVAFDSDGRLYSPSFERNFAPICEALRAYLADAEGTVLEIGSGTGQHIAHWAGEFPRLTWVPSDIHPQHYASIAAWRAALAPINLLPPMTLDASADWAAEPGVQVLAPLTAVIACNVIHIAPLAVVEGIVAGAGRALASGGALIFYGPFKEGGRHTGAGNASFDAGLRAENPAWGVRDLEKVAALASAVGFGPAGITPMPSNNRLVIFLRK